MNLGLNHWHMLTIAPLAGVLFSLAFAPYDFSYGIVLSLMFFYYACVRFPQRAGSIGYSFGLGVFGLGIWWIYLSVHDAGGADSLSALLITALAVSFFAVFPALTAILLAKTSAWPTAPLRIVGAAVVWMAIEYLRGYWLLNGFPWLLIAYSQIATPLSGYAPLFGVYGLGFLLALSAFSVVEMLQRQLKPWLGVAIVLAIWTAGWSLQQRQWTEPAGEPIKISVIQGNISQDLKWRPEQKRYTLQLYQAMTQQHWDSQLVIWPETAIPAFLHQVQGFLQPLAEEAQQHGVDLVVSLPSGEGKQYYNSALNLHDPNTLYHKHHLLPFGEYLPLQPVSGWILDLIEIPLGSFTPGAAQQTLLKAGGYPLITTICYEDAFGNEVIRQVKDAAYLLNLTNDAWFGDSAQPYQHLQISQMRALETGRYMVRSTNTGVTAFIAPDGSIQSQAPLFTLFALTDSILPMQGLTPYAQWGDAGALWMMAFFGFLGVMAYMRSNYVQKN